MRRDVEFDRLRVRVEGPPSKDFTRMTLALIAYDEATLWPHNTKSDSRSKVKYAHNQHLACHLSKKSHQPIHFSMHLLTPKPNA